MYWFCLLWTILFAAAGNVSGQELTTLLPQDDDACMRSEVNFTCTIRGSPTLTDLILAWSSTEYIGQGDALQFTSESMPGVNMSRMINGTVTAILTNSTMIDGVPVLVSMLHIVGANRTSVITCSSNSGTSERTMFFGSAFPSSPQNGEARERTIDGCDFQVTWDPPADVGRFDIDRYIIYVPSRNMMNVSFSTTIDLDITNCRVGNNSIQVAAMNRLGCIGPTSSLIQPSLMEMRDVKVSSGEFSAPVVGGIVGGVSAFFVITGVIVLLVFGCKAWEDIKQKHKEDFTENLRYLIQAIGESDSTSGPSISTPLEVPTFVSELLELMKKLEPNDIKKALTTVLASKSARRIQDTLYQLKQMVPNSIVISDFDDQLRKAGSSVTMDQLIKAPKEGNYQEFFELIQAVNKAPPKDVKDQLQNLFEKLQDYFKAEEVKKDMLLQAHREDFATHLEYLIKAILRERSSTRGPSTSTPLVPTFAHELLELMKKLEPNDIKEALKTTIFKTEVISDIQETLHQLKKRISKVMSTFDTQLRTAGSSVTIDQLIKAPKEGDHNLKELLDELKEQVNKASPKAVTSHLQMLFQELKDHHAGHARNPVSRITSFRRRVSRDHGRPHLGLLRITKVPVTGTLEEKVDDMPNEKAGELLLEFYKQLQVSVELENEIKPERNKELIREFIKKLQGKSIRQRGSKDDGLSSDDSTDGSLPLISECDPDDDPARVSTPTQEYDPDRVSTPTQEYDPDDDPARVSTPTQEAVAIIVEDAF